MEVPGADSLLKCSWDLLAGWLGALHSFKAFFPALAFFTLLPHWHLKGSEEKKKKKPLCAFAEHESSPL